MKMFKHPIRVPLPRQKSKFINAVAILLLCYFESSANAMELEFLNNQDLSSTYEFQGWPFGGISGGAQDRNSDSVYLISDDKGPSPPTRVYKAQLHPDRANILELLDTIPIKVPLGKSQESYFDGESIAVDSSGNLIISSEPRISKKHSEPQKIFSFSRTGTFLHPLPIPKYFIGSLKVDSTEGMRDNGGFESLAINRSGNLMIAINEDPLIQDGAQASLKAGGFVRVLAYTLNASSKFQPSHEYIYPLEALRMVGFEANSKVKYSQIGVSDAAFIDEDRVLVLERGSVQNEQGAWKNIARIFLVNLKLEKSRILRKNLTDKADQNLSQFAVRKQLVLDLDRVKDQFHGPSKSLDNLEALIFLHSTENSHGPHLVLMSDNNFSATQRTQILSFKILK